MCAMKINSNLSPLRPENNAPPPGWDDWFKCNFGTTVQYIQDSVHIGTKLRTRLLNEKKPVIIGNFTASPGHLKTLITNVSKDKHQLNYTDINATDKMNFGAVKALTRESVRKELKGNLPGSEATIEYLKLMEYGVFSFLRKDLTASERLYQIWYTIFFMRLWKDWLVQNKKTAENFVTSNIYSCIELNGHALINLIVLLKPDNHDQIFQPWLWSSQSCEQYFRTLRTMSTTFNTVVNFSTRDVLYRIKKIELQQDIKQKLSSNDYIFKNSHRGYSESSELNSDNYNSNFPNNDEIYSIIFKSRIDAEASAIKLGLYNVDNLHLNIPFHIKTLPIIPTSTELQDDDNVDEDLDEENNAEAEIDGTYAHPDSDIQAELQFIPNYHTLNIKNFQIG